MKITFHSRSVAEEVMDDLNCEGEVVNQTLRELDVINRWLGGNVVTLSALRQMWASIPLQQNLAIADLGCGSGEMLRIIGRIAKKQNRTVTLQGFDANPHITTYATTHSNGFKNISFFAANVFDAKFQQQSFDIIIATLFTHHFTDQQLTELLRAWKQQARVGIIINDIHRHPLAYYSIKWLTLVFSKSEMVKYDAPLSVLRAFKKSDLEKILNGAGIKHYTLRWRWAFRWQLIIPA
ncbi:MAG: methyltransferase domain-containing protein [Cyclobacteriaceae bacterium]|nr:methyltransferase domain-containing protein [Cyclobacteriaceae bacterium]